MSSCIEKALLPSDFSGTIDTHNMVSAIKATVVSAQENLRERKNVPPRAYTE